MQFEKRHLGHIADFEMGQSPDSSYVNDSHGIPFLQGCADFGAVTPQNSVYCSRPRKFCRAGDVLISVRAPVGALNKADRPYCIGRGLAGIRFREEALPRFGWHLLNYYAQQLHVVAQGSTFQAVGKKELFNLEVVIPSSKSEQRRIAEILDTIDEAIQKIEALIAKLKAMKQGLLHDLLTRGLDENGKLRDPKAHPEQFKESPLGRIPKDWDVVSLEELSSFVTSGSRGWAPFYSDEGALFLRISNLTREHVNLRFDDIRHVSPPVATTEGKRTEAREGDLLISITADLGIIGVIPPGLGEAFVNQHIALVGLNRGSADPYWIGHYLASGPSQKQFSRLNDQGAKAGLNLPTVESLVVAKPHIREQEHIARLTKAHDARIHTEEQYRDKLKLQKKGLMHDLLTGKVRVGG